MKATNYHPDSKFDSLYEIYENMVRAVVQSVLHRHTSHIDDICQQVWIEAYAQVQAGKTLSKASLRSRSRALDLRRELNDAPSSLDAMVEEEQTYVDDDCNHLIDRLQFAQQVEGADCGLDPRVREYVAKTVDSLSEPLRVVEGHYYANKSLQDLAFELSIPLGTVKRRLHDAAGNPMPTDYKEVA